MQSRRQSSGLTKGASRSALVFMIALTPALAFAQMPPDDDGEDEEHPHSAASSSASGAVNDPHDRVAPDRPSPSPSSHASLGAPSTASASSASSAVAAPSSSAFVPPKAPLPPPIRGMVFVPGARYSMGAVASDKTSAPNERPAHMETVAPFYLDKLEITVADYRSCVEKHVCVSPAKSSAQCTFDLGDPRLPINCVHFVDADTYCKSVGKRLPREAEWELAARGPQGFRMPWGGAPGGCNFAATLLHESTGKSCTGKRPAQVGTHLSGQSPFGALDMAGNVEEWVSDFYVEHIAEGAAPRAGASHVLRGGGWLSPPSMSRATSRNWGSSLEAGANVGFRCAKDLAR